MGVIINSVKDIGVNSIDLMPRTPTKLLGPYL